METNIKVSPGIARSYASALRSQQTMTSFPTQEEFMWRARGKKGKKLRLLY
jgi:hypothetical protein